MQLLQIDFLYRLFGSGDLDESITLHEVKRLPPNRLAGLTYFFDIVGGVEFIFTLPGFWVPFVHWLWRIPTVLVGAGIISHEFEDRTWNTLRATPLTLHQIIMHKFLAVMRYMEPHFMLVVYIRAAPVVIFGISWLVSTITVLPQQGFGYWISTSIAFLFSGAYLLISPVLDTAFDAALSILMSSFANRRATALVMAMFARIAGFLLPMALVIPLEYGVFSNLTGLDFIQLRAIAVISTFGPAYAFLWGLGAWVSVLIVMVYTAIRLALIRLMLVGAEIQANRVGQ
ncbi:MAG: hypothetical protein Kow0077_06970 [Anaerolineae bacterium]